MCLLSATAVTKYAEKDKNWQTTRSTEFVPKSPEAVRAWLWIQPHGNWAGYTSYPLQFKAWAPQDSRVFTFQADDLVRGLEVGMAALYLSEHARNAARLRGMLIYFIGQNAGAGNGLSAAGHTKASRIKAKTLTALKKDPEMPHSCQQILK